MYVLKLLSHSATLVHEYNTAFPVVFFSCLLDCLTQGGGEGGPQHLRERRGGRKMKEEEEDGLKTAFDMCPQRRGLSLLSVACAAVRGVEVWREKRRVDARGVKGGRVGGGQKVEG